MDLNIPELALVVLIGPSGSGKSTFAARHFKATEVIGSDTCRGLVSDDENNLDATGDAFDVVHYIAAKRLARGRLTVIDATNVKPEDRRPLVSLAKQYHCIPVAIALDVPEQVCHQRNDSRPDRVFGPHVVRNQRRTMQRSLKRLKKEGFRNITVLQSAAEVDAVRITRQPLWTNKRAETGPFDIIGDLHGCFDELTLLLEKLDYRLERSEGGYRVDHPEGRRVIFVGDLVDRGPNSPEALRLVMDMVEAGTALCVPGNHDIKLLRKLRGKNIKLNHGLAETIAQLEGESDAFLERTRDFIDGLVSHYVLDDGKLVVAHAGMLEAYQGRGSSTVRAFALYGDTDGETDEFGLPVRYNWAADYRGRALVVYGHTPTPEPEWLNNTLCIDTGCVFGGKLTALRYPERELVSIPARRIHYQPAKPLHPITDSGLTAQQAQDDLLDIEDVLGKHLITTGLHRTVTIREENALAALEAMTRFAVNPKWLTYLPPTMSPSETSQRDGYLEHPAEAFDYYRRHGVETVICQEKHMGSRAVIQLCRNETVARQRFGVTSGEFGICYSRTGRRFFNDREMETALLERLREAATRAQLWHTLDSDWLTLDCELMPWSLKAGSLVSHQYAAVGSAATSALSASLAALDKAAQRGVATGDLQQRYATKLTAAERYRTAYRTYCWPVQGVDDIRLAPFHLLASETGVHSDKDHRWHLETLARLAQSSAGWLIATPYQQVTLDDDQSVADASAWWMELTRTGGEGMVVKPLTFIARGPRGLLQPAIKCRGPEYLRIIYGPEYDQHLQRLRGRGLNNKRQLAIQEFVLGLEGLERFVNRQPLRKVHQCSLAVLALESEPVDPRL